MAVIPTSLEMEIHRLTQDPAQNNKQGRDEERNLDARANSYTHSLQILLEKFSRRDRPSASYQIHLVLDRHNNCRNMFGSVSNNRDEDKTDEIPADVRAFHEGVNTID